MLMKKTVGWVLAYFFVSTAYAQHPGLYVSAETGWSSMASDQVPNIRFHQKKRFGYRAAMGYLFPLTTRWYLGPEVAYGYYGLVSYENASGLIAFYQSTGWSVLASLRYELTNRWRLFFKGGETAMYQHYDIKGTATMTPTPGGFYQRKISPTVVAAVSYAATDHLDLSLSYTHISAEKAPVTADAQSSYTQANQVASVDAIMLGLVYEV